MILSRPRPASGVYLHAVEIKVRIRVGLEYGITNRSAFIY